MCDCWFLFARDPLHALGEWQRPVRKTLRHSSDCDDISLEPREVKTFRYQKSVKEVAVWTDTDFYWAIVARSEVYQTIYICSSLLQTALSVILSEYFNEPTVTQFHSNSFII